MFKRWFDGYCRRFDLTGKDDLPFETLAMVFMVRMISAKDDSRFPLANANFVVDPVPPMLNGPIDPCDVRKTQNHESNVSNVSA